MQFASLLALFIGALGVLPFWAHRLLRRQAEPRPFAATHLVAAAPPAARRRSVLEDRSLFAIRLLAVVALAVLGATPFVQCSRLSLARSGASVALALVLDDSMSMRAKDGRGVRFQRARAGAMEVLSSLQEGDSVALVLAGSPARVVLAPTTDLTSAKSALLVTEESDRGTDLDAALRLADSLVEKLPQVDKRVVLFSDRADGMSEASALKTRSPLWSPLPDLAGDLSDCAIVLATRQGNVVRARLQCNHAGAVQGRAVVLQATASDGKRREVARIKTEDAQKTAGGPDAPLAVDLTLAIPQMSESELSVALHSDPSGTAQPAFARAGSFPTDDAIASDDFAVVVAEERTAEIAVVTEAPVSAGVAGGVPLIEQAFAALKTGVAVTPIPSVPERNEDYASFSGIWVDDPAGLTPEQRRAMLHFLESGGVALFAFGPRAASASLGSSFEPLLAHALTWGKSPSPGVAADELAFFKDSRPSLENIEARGRIAFASDDIAGARVRAQWSDGAPFLLSRTFKLGESWMLSVPSGPEYSDLPLRPGFLSLVDSFLHELSLRAAPSRSVVGTTWILRGKRIVGRGPSADGPSSEILPARLSLVGGAVRFSPGLVGAYALTVDGKAERRVATVSPLELDMRPRAVQEAATSVEKASSRPALDVSWVVALLLLSLFASELGLRAFFAFRAPRGGLPVQARAGAAV